MSATTPNVGVRVFSDLSQSIASIDTRDSTVVGMCLPAPTADNDAFPLDEPVRLDISDPVQVAKLGTGLARDAVDQLLGEGIITDVAFVRVAHSALTDPTARLEAEIASIVGSAGAQTGIWALLAAKEELGLEPGLLIAPGYTSQRLAAAANPVATAMDGICTRIIDCLAVTDTPATSREDAAEYAADFATSLNILAMYPGAKVLSGGSVVTRPLSPSVAGAIIRSDKANGTPFRAFWNKPLTGILGTAQRVTYRDGDTTSDANYLVQAGVGTVIEGRLLWSPYCTATDPTVKGYRSIKRVRTRRSIEKALLRSLRGYLAGDYRAHLVTLISTALAEACEERKALGALIDYEILWSRGLNTNTNMRDGILRLKLRFEETPDLTDLQIFSEPQPEAFDVLAEEIAQAIQRLGNPNVRAVA